MEVYQDKQESSSHPISPSRFMVSTSTWQKHVLHAVWRREENHVESKSCWWWEGGGHLLEHRESSFCSSNMPIMSKQQLHKAGVSIHQSRLEVGLSSQLAWN